MSPRRIVSPRSTWGWVALACAAALGAAGALAATATGHRPGLGAALGASAALLAVLALPSLPTRIPSSLLLALGGVVVVRHVRQPGTELALVAMWALATLLALVLIDRADLDERPRLTAGPPLPVLAGETARSMVVLAAVVLVVASLLVPVLGHRPTTSRLGSGDVPRFGGSGSSGSSLARNDTLDTTVRPRLGNEVVMTVTASRPAFWRGETFDVWDGHAWTRSDNSYLRLPSAGDTAYPSPPIGMPATTETSGRLLTQIFRIEAPYAEVLFAAAEPVEVRPVPLGRRDGTLLSFAALGRGSSYRVVSRVPNATESTLRAADANTVPADVAKYAQPPIVTARVRALAERVTAGKATTYDKVRALEAWMGAHTEYTLDAPVARQGVDVVDDFLFNVRRGWCEQIASSLVVMLRTRGIPARLATGFVPGDRSRLTGEWVVRAKHAHAWAEVYFPGVGWQAFDPTASVPLAGEVRAPESLLGWLGRHAAVIAGLLLVVGTLVAAGSAVAGFVARRRARRSRSWAARRLDDLERLGSGAGRARRPSETAPEYADALAGVLGNRRLRTVGAAIDADAFSPDGIAPEERAAADAVLEGIAARTDR